MRRVHAIDVLVCPSCQGPMRVVAFIEDERIARRILDHLGLPSRAPPRGPPWTTGQQQLHLDLAAFSQFDGIDPLPVE